MCGIAGIASATRDAPSSVEVEARVRRMIGRLAHRGPDGEGVESLAGCALAHRRLAIIDLSPAGSQPMANEDGTLRVVFNGEIYNHVELRRDLEPRHPFRSRSDTEVILHLYEEKGDALVESLRGMFAFALWDSRRRRLLLARDRLGKKPLHYRLSPEGISFASEIPALLAGGGGAEFDPSILGTYLALGYIPAPATAIRGIERLPAGCTLAYEAGRAAVRRYWTPPLPRTAPAARQGDLSTVDVTAATPRVPSTIGEAAAAITPILEEGVRIRLRSDVPLGVFLSGGIDSAVVAALAARQSGERLRTFTVVFEESGYDESAPARLTAAAIGSDHHEIRLEARAAEALPALIKMMGEPFADSSLIAVHRLSEAVRRDVKVALSGDGGDEVFLGYDRYRAHRLADRWQRLPALARQAAVAAAGVLPGTRGRRNLSGRAGRFIEAASADPFSRNDRWVCRFAPEDLAGVLTGDAAAVQPADPLEPLHRLYREAGGAASLDAVARADLALWLPEDVLRKVDAASMACALEVRSPLLDQEVVQAAASIPASVKMPRAKGKEVLKAIALDLLPRAVLRGKKAGFGLPVDRWLRSGTLKDFARDALLGKGARSRDFVRQDAVRRLFDEHLIGAANHDERIWTLLCLEVFLRDVVGSAP